MIPTLNDRTSAELAEALAPHGVPVDVARRLFARVHARGAAADLPAARGLSLAATRRLGGARAGRLEIVSRRRSPADSFVKYLFRLDGGALAEAVLIPLPAGPDTTP